MHVPMDLPDGAASYLTWGIFQISVPNLVVVSLLVLVFALALVLPFPGGHDEETDAKADHQ